MKAADVRGAFASGTRIHGWLTLESALLMGMIDDVQKEHGLVGDLFEIGVHHGRSAVLLASMARASTERLGVCDLFSAQDRNVSRSGSGDREIFEQNVRGHVGRGLVVDIHDRPSSTLTADLIGKNYRLFHVDGGHDAHEALADLELAAKVTQPKGMIIIDDAFSATWPGVSEGLITFLQRHPDWVGAVLGFHKLYLCRREALDMYVAAVDDPARREAAGFGAWAYKTLPLAGSPLRIFYARPPGRRKSASERVLGAIYRRLSFLRAPVFAPAVEAVRRAARAGGRAAGE
jgi:hypothetical protein